MIITGITPHQFVQLTARVGARDYQHNLRAELSSQMSDTRFRARVTVIESGARQYPRDTSMSAAGARRSASGRRIKAACWHAYRDVLAELFELYPNARVYTAMAKYIGRDGFRANYPATADINMGSMMSPARMPDLCSCRDHGICVRESERV